MSGEQFNGIDEGVQSNSAGGKDGHPEHKKVTFWGTFGLSFSILSVLNGTTSLYGEALLDGGPPVVIWGWVLVSIMTLLVGLSMGEISSAFPASGGLYFWPDYLIPEEQREWRPFASWVTGYCNMIGQIACTASTFFSAAELAAIMVTIGTGGANGGGIVFSRGQRVLICGVLYIFSGLYNSLPVEFQSKINVFAAAWNVLLMAVLIVGLPLLVKNPQPTSVFFEFYNGTTGITNPLYVCLLGLLVSQFTLSGYDGAFQIAGEAKDPEWNVPFSLVCALGITSAIGFAYLWVLTTSITSFYNLFATDTVTAGQAQVAQIFWDAFDQRFGYGNASLGVLALIWLTIWLSGNSLLTSNARMIYSFSKDRGIPGSVIWIVIDKHRVPIYAVWFSAFLGMSLVVPYIWSTVAYTAATSISTIGLYITYGIPIFIRTVITRDKFVPGSFNLGWWSPFNGSIAIGWIGIITVAFVLPTALPITAETFNYTGIAIGGWFAIVITYWFTSGRFFFKQQSKSPTLE